MPRPANITRYHPYVLPVVWAWIIIAFAVCDWYQKRLFGVRIMLMFIFGVAFLLSLPKVVVSDELVVVSWVFGLRRRRIPLKTITEILHRSDGARGWPRMVICVANGKSCSCSLGHHERDRRLAQDIRMRLKHHPAPAAAP